MDIKFTDSEINTYELVTKKVNRNSANIYTDQYTKIRDTHKNLTDAQIQDLISKFVKQRDTERDNTDAIVMKVAMLLHFYRLNGTSEVSLLELIQQVFLENGEDYHNIKMRRLLSSVMLYYTALEGVKLIYATTDKKSRILFVQEPTVTLENNKAVIDNVKLLGDGEYEKEKQDDGSYFCYIKGAKDDGIVLNEDNYQNYINVIYIVSQDPNIQYTNDSDKSKSENSFVISQKSSKYQF